MKLIKITKLKKLFQVFLFSILFSCAKGSFTSDLASTSPFNKPNDSGNNNPGNNDPLELYTPLTWEKTMRERAAWSAMVYQIIQTQEPGLLNQQVNDMATFCPRYDELSKMKKLNFWGQLISSMAKFESGWKPTDRYVETTMGTDPVTGQKVVSEGLLQLSYQDVKNHPGLCLFDWSKDKLLSANDPRKTIFDPFKNLQCGVRILARQIRNKHAIAVDQGAYWSVIKLGNSHQHIQEISRMIRDLDFCD